jgi:hypothetical protein
VRVGWILKDKLWQLVLFQGMFVMGTECNKGSFVLFFSLMGVVVCLWVLRSNCKRANAHQLNNKRKEEEKKGAKKDDDDNEETGEGVKGEEVKGEEAKEEKVKEEERGEEEYVSESGAGLFPSGFIRGFIAVVVKLMIFLVVMACVILICVHRDVLMGEPALVWVLQLSKDVKIWMGRKLPTLCNKVY